MINDFQIYIIFLQCCMSQDMHTETKQEKVSNSKPLLPPHTHTLLSPQKSLQRIPHVCVCYDKYENKGKYSISQKSMKKFFFQNSSNNSLMRTSKFEVICIIMHFLSVFLSYIVFDFLLTPSSSSSSFTCLLVECIKKARKQMKCKNLKCFHY